MIHIMKKKENALMALANFTIIVKMHILWVTISLPQSFNPKVYSYHIKQKCI